VRQDAIRELLHRAHEAAKIGGQIMPRAAQSTAALMVTAAIAVSSGPATSYQLPGIPGGIPGLNSSSILSQAESFFSQAVSKASPQTTQKINELVGLFKSGAQSGHLTNGTSQVQSVFPHATTEQQAVLRTTGYSGLLSQLGSSGLEKLGGADAQSLLNGFTQADTNMNSILGKTHDTPSSVISHL
jgi:hypothetical protein